MLQNEDKGQTLGWQQLIENEFFEVSMRESSYILYKIYIYSYTYRKHKKLSV